MSSPPPPNAPPPPSATSKPPTPLTLDPDILDFHFLEHNSKGNPKGNSKSNSKNQPTYPNPHFHIPLSSSSASERALRWNLVSQITASLGTSHFWGCMPAKFFQNTYPPPKPTDCISEYLWKVLCCVLLSRAKEKLSEVPGLWTGFEVKEMAKLPKDGGWAGMVQVSFQVEEDEELREEVKRQQEEALRRGMQRYLLLRSFGLRIWREFTDRRNLPTKVPEKEVDAL